MSLTGIAALIAAVSFAVLALAGAYVAVRLTRVLHDAATLVRETRAGQEAVLARAGAAVDRTGVLLDQATEQLARSEAVSASMDELGAGMSELARQVSALAGLRRSVAGAVAGAVGGGPVGKAAAVAYGVRHAVALRRGGGRRRALPGQVVK